ncbi:App1 family protein [Polaribacter sp. R77954]|uniref:App1 family protein n=1 Tax=Polaribacter sp. R77954 TaxID=3093870 RepID=UPI0037C5A446
MSIFTNDPLQIIVFQSYGTENHFYARGRALEDEKITLESRNIFKILLNSWKRFESDEIKNCNLVVTLPNQHQIKTKTDKNGYFIIDEKVENLSNLTTPDGWLHYQVSYANEIANKKINKNNCFQGALLIPPKNANFGVISDIDDTILHTGVVSLLKWRLIVNTFFKSPFTRKALKGTSHFYSLLHAGISKKNTNPFFYVSHSPWNMYRYLEYFLSKNNFPKGAILLRAMSSLFSKNRKEKPQKQQEIINILNTYKTLPFILIGDAGEHDTEIYMQTVTQFPNRIKAIYVRSVTKEKNNLRIQNLVKNYTDTLFLLVKNSDEAIAHAKKNKFIA